MTEYLINGKRIKVNRIFETKTKKTFIESLFEYFENYNLQECEEDDTDAKTTDKLQN